MVRDVIGRTLRGSLLAAAVLACVASSSSRSQSAQPAYTAPEGSRPGVYWCYTMRSNANTSSACFGDYGRCDRERQAASTDGLFTMYCAQASPVSCFQLRGDPSPSMEMCGATADDCELWRQIDLDKNGATGEVCAWRH